MDAPTPRMVIEWTGSPPRMALQLRRIKRPTEVESYASNSYTQSIARFDADIHRNALQRRFTCQYGGPLRDHGRKPPVQGGACGCQRAGDAELPWLLRRAGPNHRDRPARWCSSHVQPFPCDLGS